jgi:hypothetical protein
MGSLQMMMKIPVHRLQTDQEMDPPTPTVAQNLVHQVASRQMAVLALLQLTLQLEETKQIREILQTRIQALIQVKLQLAVILLHRPTQV